jgi:zinc D-Ala-D-Ala carboxypeptidase
MNDFPKEFPYEEMIHSQTAARFGIDNKPPAAALKNLKATAFNMLGIRQLLGNKPVLVSSGYRSPGVNAKVGGSNTSAHTLGWAVDFTCPGFGKPLNICEAIATSRYMDDIDQLIHEYDSWVHISWDPRNRKQILTINRSGTFPGLR